MIPILVSHRVIDNQRDISPTRFFNKIQLVSVSRLEKMFDLERQQNQGQWAGLGFKSLWSRVGPYGRKF